MRSQLNHRRPGRYARRLLPASALLLGACGPSLTTMATEAMDLCLQVRNPAFTSGQGATALAAPLPDRARELGERMNYGRAYKVYRGIAEDARDQATLVCALEMASYYHDGEARRFIERYLRHPDAAVAASAAWLLTDPATRPLPAAAGEPSVDQPSDSPAAGGS
jgi:hypothetical protein